MKTGLFVFTFLYSGLCLANEVGKNLPEVDPISSSNLLKISLGLGFILFLIFALAWVLKKMQITQYSNNQLIKIVSAISVGQRDRIALVQIGDEQIVVGLSPGQMHKLHTMKTVIDVENADVSTTQNQFAEKFSQLMKKDRTRDQ